MDAFQAEKGSGLPFGLKNLFRKDAEPFIPESRSDGTATASQAKAAKLTAQNNRLTQMARSAFERASRWKEIYDDGRNYLYSNQLAHFGHREGWPEVQVNHLFPAAMQEISMLAQRRVTIRSKPQDVTDTPNVELWGPKLRFWYEYEADMPQRLISFMLDGKINGHWIVKYAWDPHWKWDERAKGGRGAWIGTVKPILLHVDFVGVDPEAESFEDARYVVIQYRKGVDDVIAQWPKHKDAILRAASSTDNDGLAGLSDGLQGVQTAQAIQPQKEKRDPSRTAGRISDLLARESGNEFQADVLAADDGSGEARPLYVTVQEFWFKDDETARRPAEMADLSDDEMRAAGVPVGPDGVPVDEAGNPYTSETWPKREVWPADEHPKYPNGRHVVRVGPETILNDSDDDQVWQYGYWPVVIGVNIPLPHTWHGYNAVEQGKDQQDWINEIWAHIGNAIRYFGDPQWLVEDGALFGDDGKGSLGKKIKSRSGAIIRVNAGKIGAIARQAAVPVDASALNVLSRQEENLRQNTGMHLTGMGQESQRDMTATESATLAANSQARTALQSLMLDFFVIRSLYVVADIFQREYAAGAISDGDLMRVVGLPGQASTEMARMPYQSGMALTPFEITIEATSAVPFDRQRRKQDATELYKLFQGVPAAAEYVLDAYEVPNKQEWMQAVAMMQTASQPTAQSRTGETWQPGQVAQGGQSRPMTPESRT